ncbi:MAG: hypothetical protein U0136_20450 [Bdellovibrionota bacterium]
MAIASSKFCGRVIMREECRANELGDDARIYASADWRYSANGRWHLEERARHPRESESLQRYPWVPLRRSREGANRRGTRPGSAEC